jgi:hypothetical protein
MLARGRVGVSHRRGGLLASTARTRGLKWRLLQLNATSNHGGVQSTARHGLQRACCWKVSKHAGNVAKEQPLWSALADMHAHEGFHIQPRSTQAYMTQPVPDGVIIAGIAYTLVVCWMPSVSPPDAICQPTPSWASLGSLYMACHKT